MVVQNGAIAPESVASIMLAWYSLRLVSCHNLQTLWAGYGHICAITAQATTDEAAARLDSFCAQENGSAGSTYPLILKLISPPQKAGADQDEGHLRKIFSYEVEQYFYTEVAPKLPGDVAVAQCLASTRDMSGKDGAHELQGLMATLMTDLRPQFPVSGQKRAVLNETQVLAALDWLSKFHRRSWDFLPDEGTEYVQAPLVEVEARKLMRERPEHARPRKLWENGGYTYLATRMSEYQGLRDDEDSEWSTVLCQAVNGRRPLAEDVAFSLTPFGRACETYIHGDVKSENLFTTQDGTKAAFFDFQYVGLGLGVCDLAKLFTCSVPLEMLVDDPDLIPHESAMGAGEKRLLELYRTTLLEGGSRTYPWELFKLHWETALVDWLRFQASWGFWGNTEWLEARVRSICKDEAWRSWVADLDGMANGRGFAEDRPRG